MSFLVPLYIAGFLTVSLPLVFHLIRRTPKGRTSFSSLMFLEASPPRLTRRSRLDQIWLLLLRALALVLMALAFSRPFYRASEVSAVEAPGRRVAVLLDTSASLQRDGLWRQALARVEEVVAESDVADQLALYSFDSELRTRVGFEEVRELETASARELLLERLGGVAPTSSRSLLGKALAQAADLLESTVESAVESPGRFVGLQIVLISDMQEGSAIGGLETYDWPENVQLEVRPVTLPGGNAGLIRIGGEESLDDQGRMKVRVVNSIDATRTRFQLEWRGTDSKASDSTGRDPNESPEPWVQVGPGESRVVLAPPRPPSGDADRLVLIGDDCDFDNSLFVAPALTEGRTVVYLGAQDDGSSSGLRFYLERVFPADGRRPVAIEDGRGAIEYDPSRCPFIVSGEPVEESRRAALEDYVARGGVLLTVLPEVLADDPSMPSAVLETVRWLLNDPGLRLAEAEVRREYAMLGEIDYRHPLFQPFADPRFSDFTQIHFWKHRSIQVSPEANVTVVARFEGGEPFLIERSLGAGRILVQTSGWNPTDSQLARSTKFPPLMSRVLHTSPHTASLPPSFSVGEPVPLAATGSRDERRVVFPDGTTAPLAAEMRSFDGGDEPGLYRLIEGSRERSFAVNLDPAESKTAPLDMEELSRRGVLLGRQAAVPSSALERQLRDVELEKKQRVWQWLLAVALLVLILESWLGGRLARKNTPVGAEA